MIYINLYIGTFNTIKNLELQVIKILKLYKLNKSLIVIN